MARPRLSKDGIRIPVSYSISTEEMEKLEAICKRFNCKKSEAIRAAISFIYRATKQMEVEDNGNG